MSAPRNTEEYLHDLERRLEGVRGRGRVIAEVHDHLRQAIADERARGLTADEAEQRALVRCGDPAGVARPFLVRPPVYVDLKVKWLVASLIAVALIKGLVLASVPESVSVYNLDDDLELRLRALGFIALFVVLGGALLARWGSLKHHGALVEVGSADELPPWHKRARRWLAVTAPVGYVVALTGLWTSTRWAAVGATAIGLGVPLMSFAVVRRHSWRQAIS